jgi:transposase
VKEKGDTQKRRKYDAEFKKEVLNMVYHGRPVREISQSLGISENLIYRWKSRSASAGSSITQIDSTAGRVSYAEHEKLKAQLKQTEQERDILKKALGIFSRGD